MTVIDISVLSTRVLSDYLTDANVFLWNIVGKDLVDSRAAMLMVALSLWVAVAGEGVA